MNTPDPIPVFPGELDGQPVQLVDARTLHGFLGPGRPFAAWIKDRIAQYGFQEGRDFLRAAPEGRTRPRSEYHFSLDAAKDLATLERSEKGREARRLFTAHQHRALEAARPEPLQPFSKELEDAVHLMAFDVMIQVEALFKEKLEQLSLKLLAEGYTEAEVIAYLEGLELTRDPAPRKRLYDA